MKRASHLVGKFLGAFFITLAAAVSFVIPGSDVPQTGQTLAVLLVGVALGSLRGATSVVIYLVFGAVGLPVFAGGAGGSEHLLGATGGFLVGFVPAAVIAGWATESAVRAECPTLATFVRLSALMVAAHVVVLALGWARLAFAIGSEDAFARGVAPFLVGGLVKSLAAALVAVVVVSMRRRGATSSGRLAD